MLLARRRGCRQGKFHKQFRQWSYFLGRYYSANSTLPSQVPLIDIGAAIRGECIDSVSKEICSAANKFGAFQVTNHGIDTNKILGESRKFLSSTTEKKMMTSKGDGIWGYFGLLGEKTLGTPDVKEGIYFRSMLSCLKNIDLSDFALKEPNKWPQQTDFPQFRDTVESHFSAVHATACAVSKCISSGLGIETDYFIKNTISQFEQTGIFRYHHNHDDMGLDWGIGPHSDRGFLAVIVNDNGGLQVQLPSSDIWVDVPPVDNAVVILVNDYLDYITNGFCKTSIHRVLKPPLRDRYSVTTFVVPHLNLEMTLDKIGDGVSDHVQDIIKKKQYTTIGEHVIEQFVLSLTRQ